MATAGQTHPVGGASIAPTVSVAGSRDTYPLGERVEATVTIQATTAVQVDETMEVFLNNTRSIIKKQYGGVQLAAGQTIQLTLAQALALDPVIPNDPQYLGVLKLVVSVKPTGSPAAVQASGAINVLSR